MILQQKLEHQLTDGKHPKRSSRRLCTDMKPLNRKMHYPKAVVDNWKAQLA
jgi:hypothetical protein